MSLISSPLFKSDATENLEAVDAYDISNTRPINKLFDAAKGIGNKLIDRAGGVRGIANGIQAIAQAKASGLSGRQLLEQGLSVFGTSSAGIIRTAGDSILGKAGAFLELKPETIGKIKSATNQVANQIMYGDPSDISNYGELAGLIGSLTGNDEIAEYINIGYEAAVWGAVLTESIEYGSSYYIGDVKQYIDPTVYRQALLYSVPAVASSGDMTALDQLLDQLNPDEIMAEKSDFVRTFLSRYTLPSPLTASLEGYSDDLYNKMAQLDSRWYLYSLEGTDIIDLGNMISISEDGKKVLQLHQELGPWVQLAPEYAEKTVGELIREQFPLLVQTTT